MPRVGTARKRAKREAALRGWETRRANERARERERKRRAKARKAAEKERKKKAAIAKRRETIERQTRERMRMLKKRMRGELKRMIYEVETGKGLKPWLASKATHDDYSLVKNEARITLPKRSFFEILESLQDSLNLQDYGWNIVY